MKTKVAIVLPDFHFGGAQVMVCRLVSHLNLEKVDAEVIVCGQEKGNDLERAIVEHGVPIRYLGKTKGFSAKVTADLFRELDRFHPQVIHTHLSACVYCAPWVIVRRRTMLHTVHNMPQHELIRPKRLVMKAMYRFGCAVPVGISREIYELTEAYYHPKKQPELVYNPVNIKQFTSMPKREHTAFTVLNVGRLSEQKNQQLLIRAFSGLHKLNAETELLILGEGPKRQELEDLIREEGLGECVHLEGKKEKPEEYFARADVFALSSIYEGLPLVLLEAMAASLPIVSTNVGGVKDIVSENGILTENKNEEQLKDALIRLMENPDLRRQMGGTSFAEVQKYDSAVIADEYAALYEKYARNKF